MYNRYLHRQRMTPEPKITSFSLKSKEKMSQNAYRRAEDWSFNNCHLLKEVFGPVPINHRNSSLKKTLTPQKKYFIPQSDPYSESNFVEILRKPQKDKNLAGSFFRIKYSTAQERISQNTLANSNIDICPNRTPSPLSRVNFKEKPKKSLKNHEKPFTLREPYIENASEDLCRKRIKSLELGKTFFVTSKVPETKPNLLISKNYEDFYSKLSGTSKIYKNSIRDLFHLSS